VPTAGVGLTQAIKRCCRSRVVGVGVRCVFERNWLRSCWCLRARVDGLLDGRRYRRRCPAVALGLTDPIWGWEEFLTYRRYHYSKG